MEKFRDSIQIVPQKNFFSKFNRLVQYSKSLRTDRENITGRKKVYLKILKNGK